MSFQDTLATRINVITGGQKNLLLTNAYYSVPQYIANSGRTELPYTVSLNSQPQNAVALTVAINAVQCVGSKTALNPNAAPTVPQPSRFVFYANSTSLSAIFFVRGTLTGCYVMSAAVNGECL